MRRVTCAPRPASSRGSAYATSARPPTLAKGTASAVTKATRRGSPKLLLLPAVGLARAPGAAPPGLRRRPSDHDQAQGLGRHLGGRRIDVKAAAPLEARDLGQL